MGSKVLGLLFSGRKNGNSSIMMEEVLKPLRESGVECEVVTASSLDIKNCIGCFGCNNGEFKCVLKDDLENLKRKIESADAVVLVSPCYIFGPPAVMKCIMDRSAAWALNEIEIGAPKKIGVSLSFAGANGEWCSMQKATSSLFLKLFNCDVRLQKLYEGVALKGEILLRPDILAEAKQIGEQLRTDLGGGTARYSFDEADKRLTCAVCGNDMFRIVGKTCTCAVCGKQYKQTLSGMKEIVGTDKFTPEGAREHNEIVGSRIENGFAASEEIERRMQDYLADGTVPHEPYVAARKEEAPTAEWSEDGIAEFERVVPRAFQKFVKKAVEAKASERGIGVITKDVFLKIKKESGN